MKLRVLIACEFSGAVRDAFAALGHEAWSSDFHASETPGNHHQGDVREILDQHWDFIGAHPDCDYIANSGVRWLDRDIDRWKKLWDACEFFKLFVNHPCHYKYIENPIPHKYALGWIGRKYNQVVQPYQFGDPFQKATCLWTFNLPDLKPTNIVTERKQSCWLESPGPERKKNRSRTYAGIAKAMAQQYTDWIKSNSYES